MKENTKAWIGTLLMVLATAFFIYWGMTELFMAHSILVNAILFIILLVIITLGAVILATSGRYDEEEK